MAAQTPEVSSRLIDFQNGPVLLQPLAFPPPGPGGEQGREGPGLGSIMPPRAGEGRAAEG